MGQTIRAEARGDRGAHPPDIDPPIIPRRMRLNRKMFERVWSRHPMFGLPCHSNLQTTLSADAKELSKNSRKSLKELPRSLATERIERARHEERDRHENP